MSALRKAFPTRVVTHCFRNRLLVFVEPDSHIDFWGVSQEGHKLSYHSPK